MSITISTAHIQGKSARDHPSCPKADKRSRFAGNSTDNHDLSGNGGNGKARREKGDQRRESGQPRQIDWKCAHCDAKMPINSRETGIIEEHWRQN